MTTPDRPTDTPDAGPTIGEAYTRLAPWLRELDGPDLDNFYAAFARLRDEWQARTPDPSPAGEADLAAERLSDLVAYDPDLKLVLAEIPRLRAALAAAEARLAEVTKERDEQAEELADLVKMREERSNLLDSLRADAKKAIREALGTALWNRFWGPELERLGHVVYEVWIDRASEREKRRAAEGREAELRVALGEAAEQVHQWGCYADEYHRSKWDLKGNIERLRKLAAPAGPGEAGKETP